MSNTARADRYSRHHFPSIVNLFPARMSRNWLVATILLGALVPLGLAQPPSAPLELGSPSRVAPSHATVSLPDTLRSSTPIGTPLVLSLPAEVSETPVTRYTLIQGPSLSGVAKQSFAWIPRDTDPGTYDIHLQAHHPDAQPDTLVLRVDVES